MNAPEPTQGRVSSSALLAGSITLILWASAFTAINVGLEGYSPLHLTLLRFLVASAFFVVVALVSRMPAPKRGDLGPLFVTGLCGITTYHIALNIGQLYVPAGTTGLIIGTAPIFTALFSHRFLGERLTPWGWTSIGISFLGIVVILLGDGESLEFAAGAGLILLSAILGAVYFVLVKKLVSRYSALQVTTYVTWAGTLPMMLFLPGLAEAIATAPPAATWAVVYAGVFPAAIAYVTWGMALERAPASQVAPLLFLSPVLGLFVAWILIGEVPTVSAMIGGSIALGGVILLHRFGSPETTQRKASHEEGIS